MEFYIRGGFYKSVVSLSPCGTYHHVKKREATDGGLPKSFSHSGTSLPYDGTHASTSVWKQQLPEVEMVHCDWGKLSKCKWRLR